MAILFKPVVLVVPAGVSGFRVRYRVRNSGRGSRNRVASRRVLRLRPEMLDVVMPFPVQRDSAVHSTRTARSAPPNRLFSVVSSSGCWEIAGYSSSMSLTELHRFPVAQLPVARRPLPIPSYFGSTQPIPFGPPDRRRATIPPSTASVELVQHAARLSSRSRVVDQAIELRRTACSPRYLVPECRDISLKYVVAVVGPS